MNTKSICVFLILFIAIVKGVSIWPNNINVQSGTKTNQGIEVLRTNVLTGNTDDYDNYISFNGRSPNPRFIGTITFDVSGVSLSSVSSAVINVNYRGPKTSQTWHWSAVNTNGVAVKIGDNTQIASSWIWTQMTFTIPAPFSSYVSSNTFTLKYESLTNTDSSHFDFLELLITTNNNPGTPSPNPTPSPPPTCSAPYPGASCTKTAVCSAQTSGPTRMMIPLYIYPSGSAWAPIASAASKVDIVAIINPSSGPYPAGSQAETDNLATYNSGISTLVNAGVKVVGYVSSNYSSRSETIVKNEISLYKAKYPGVSGIFVDEVGVFSSNSLSYYTSLSNHIRQNSYTVVFNPGDVNQDYFGPYRHLADIHLVAELAQSGVAARVTSIAQAVNGYCSPSSPGKFGYKYAFSGVVHSSSSNYQSVITSLRNAGMGYVYVTDQTPGGNGQQWTNEYNPLATFFSAQVDYIDSL